MSMRCLTPALAKRKPGNRRNRPVTDQSGCSERIRVLRGRHRAGCPGTGRASRQGMALVLVLAVLVLFSALAMAVFLISKAERESSAIFASTLETRQLADSSINLCLAQIQDATSATHRAWVSQPGLIRTFTGDRQPDVNYRLYSWTTMRPAGAFDPFSADNAIPSGWQSRKALFVDLNEPAPDPSAPTDTTRDRYPILYPPALAASGNGSKPAGYAVDGNPSATGAPMPVKWLYVLRDGSIEEPVDTGNATTVRIDAASADNPIVGRIAFWADDESAKVNLNTAAGGFPWMPPWVQNAAETTPTTSPRPWGSIYGFGYGQPMKNEFQRYPGHPATTDVQAVFPELSWRDIYRLTPRVIEGGSQNGVNRARRLAADNVTPIEMVNDRDRLYAGMGEVRYQASKASASAPRSSLAGNLTDAGLNAEQWNRLLEKRKGLVTVSSRAPELNLFGQPRVAIWPVPERDTAPDGKPFRTAIDKLIAFAATLENHGDSPTARYPFYFDRRTGTYTATSQVPKNTSLDPDADITRARNTELFRYLQRLTDTPFPGVSGTAFAAKWGNRGRDQVLTEIFDYIRATNIEDKQLDEDRRFSRWNYVRPTRWDAGHGEVTGFGRAFSLRQLGFLFICNADAAVPKSNRAPGEPEGGTGFKENLALEEFPGGKLAADQRRIQALLIVELFSPSAGFKSFLTLNDPSQKHLSNFSFRVKGLENLTINGGVNLGFPGGSAPPPVPLGRLEGGKDLSSYNGSFGIYGGAMNYRWPYMGRNARGMDVGAHRWGPPDASTAAHFPYVSLPITVTVNATTPKMTLNGGNLTVEIFSGYNGGQPETLLETISVHLDQVTLPVPRLRPDKENYWAFHQEGVFGDGTYLNSHGRFRQSPPSPTPSPTPPPPTLAPVDTATSENQVNGSYSNQSLILDTPADTPYDVIQTYILPHGDTRALFAPTVGSLQGFVPVPEMVSWPATTPPALNPPRPNMRHFLSDSGPGGGIFGYTSGAGLVPAAGKRWSGVAMAPMLLSYPTGFNAPWTYGDWDTGSPLLTTDGPLINKPDEGSTYDTATINPYANTETESEVNAVASLFHSANRQIPSAVMFGSLPTGLIAGQPWQTLLFRPNPGGHPGANDPADHLLLDLFWMPVAEPYAISEPFSTAGKVNMNYQMIPFTHIERSTGMRAVLQGTQIGAIPETNPRGYGKIPSSAAPWDPQFAFDINADETLKPFQSKFSAGGVFLTPSEITTLWLVPEGETQASVAAFWNSHRLTGENIKERPYATIYPRITTQSNVFNIHYRAQALRKQPGSDPTLWNEDKDRVVAQLRGNALVERFIDMNRLGGIPDFALPANADKTAGALYRFRILSNQEFQP